MLSQDILLKQDATNQDLIRGRRRVRQPGSQRPFSSALPGACDLDRSLDFSPILNEP